MLALIDADILLYELGSCTDAEGHPLKWPLVKARVDGKILQIRENSGSSDYKLFITGEGNFRFDRATILPYKGKRAGEKPHHYQKVKDYISTSSNFDGKVVIANGYEADDAMSMLQYRSDKPRETCICSRDKDLKMVPGMHYQWAGLGGKQKEVPTHEVSEQEGLQWFFKQMIMGDSVDNIPGLFGKGKTNADYYIKKDMTPDECYARVRPLYEGYFGSYWKQFMWENAALLWMLRTEDTRDSEYLMDEFEQRYQESIPEEEF